MSKFSQRSYKAELMDNTNIPFKDWEDCLKELNTINTYLGGHKVTQIGVSQLLPNEGNFTIAEIGCGGGDNLNAIHRWNKNKAYNLNYIGIDVNQSCIDFATKSLAHLNNIQFIHSDYRLVNFENAKPDIIFTSLFCHHFTNRELIEMLIWLKRNSKVGFFINDLHRHPVAYHLIKWITAVFSSSYLVKYDAPLSVLRGFRKDEWRAVLTEAGLDKYTIKWKWAFRHLITASNE